MAHYRVPVKILAKVDPLAISQLASRVNLVTIGKFLRVFVMTSFDGLMRLFFSVESVFSPCHVYVKNCRFDDSGWLANDNARLKCAG